LQARRGGRGKFGCIQADSFPGAYLLMCFGIPYSPRIAMLGLPCFQVEIPDLRVMGVFSLLIHRQFLFG
jgi:hypothetical protein